MIAPESIPGRTISLGLLAVLLGLVWFALCAPLVTEIAEKSSANDVKAARYQKLLMLVERGMPEAPPTDLAEPENLQAPSRAGAQASLQRLSH